MAPVFDGHSARWGSAISFVVHRYHTITLPLPFCNPPIGRFVSKRRGGDDDDEEDNDDDDDDDQGSSSRRGGRGERFGGQEGRARGGRNSHGGGRGGRGGSKQQQDDDDDDQDYGDYDETEDPDYQQRKERFGGFEGRSRGRRKASSMMEHDDQGWRERLWWS